MKASIKNVQRVMEFIIANHEDNMRGGEFDDETNLINAVERVIDMFDDEPTFCCSNCGGGFLREEMTFGEDEDLCNDCAK